jgi:hypothetical protein
MTLGTLPAPASGRSLVQGMPDHIEPEPAEMAVP